MTVIPVGFGQVNILWGGTQLPHGASISFGVENLASVSAAQVCNQVATAWNGSGIMANLSEDVQTELVRCKLGPETTGPFAEQVHVTQGLNAGSGNAPNLAILVQKRSALGGRANRGRFYLPGPNEDELDESGTFTLAFRDAIAGTMDAFFDDMIVRQLPLVILHDSLASPTDVISLEVPILAASQRNRMRR